jgi:hypothetical protein
VIQSARALKEAAVASGILIFLPPAHSSMPVVAFHVIGDGSVEDDIARIDERRRRIGGQRERVKFDALRVGNSLRVPLFRTERSSA